MTEKESRLSFAGRLFTFIVITATPHFCGQYDQRVQGREFLYLIFFSSIIAVTAW